MTEWPRLEKTWDSDEKQVRFRTRRVLMPLPALMLCWEVPSPNRTNIDPPIMTGPHHAVAISYSQEEMEWNGYVHQRMIGSKPDSGHMATRGSITAPEVEEYADMSLLEFVLLPKNCGEWEDLTVSQTDIFFSEDAARNALRLRTEEWEEMRAAGPL